MWGSIILMNQHWISLRKITYAGKTERNLKKLLQTSFLFLTRNVLDLFQSKNREGMVHIMVNYSIFQSEKSNFSINLLRLYYDNEDNKVKSNSWINLKKNESNKLLRQQTSDFHNLQYATSPALNIKEYIKQNGFKCLQRQTTWLVKL